MQGNSQRMEYFEKKGMQDMEGKVCVFLAEGFEEIEGLTVVDILRRADVRTEMVSITGQKRVAGAHQIEVQADGIFEETDFTSAVMLVLPGGMPGTLHLEQHEGLKRLLEKFYQEEKYIGAICAAPSILGKMGMLAGKKAVSYPTKEGELHGAEVMQEAVVQDGAVITSRGMGTAIVFALKLLEILRGKECVGKIKESIIY